MNILSFGPFTLDTRTLELWRYGQPVPIRPQPCRLLALLASRPGELVTREEVAATLWSGIHVRFDLGLNSCLKQIRAALEDDAHRPRWVETLPRRGYRFIGSLQPDAYRPVPEVRRLLILPFRAVPPGEELAAPLVPALTDEVEICLAQLSPGLKVAAPGSLPGMMIARPSIRALGKAGIDLVLDCRVHCAAPAMRVAAQLLDTAERTVIWADMFEGNVGDRFGMQRSVALGIGYAVRSILWRAPEQRLAG